MEHRLKKYIDKGLRIALSMLLVFSTFIYNSKEVEAANDKYYIKFTVKINDALNRKQTKFYIQGESGQIYSREGALKEDFDFTRECSSLPEFITIIPAGIAPSGKITVTADIYDDASYSKVIATKSAWYGVDGKDRHDEGSHFNFDNPKIQKLEMNPSSTNISVPASTSAQDVTIDLNTKTISQYNKIYDLGNTVVSYTITPQVSGVMVSEGKLIVSHAANKAKENTFTVTARVGASYTSDNIEKTVSKSFTLSKKTYSIKYDKNTTDNVTNMPAAQNKTATVSLNLSDKVPVRTGYDFKGWQYNGVTYKSGAAFTEESNATLKAVWEIKKFETPYDTVDYYFTNFSGTTINYGDDCRFKVNLIDKYKADNLVVKNNGVPLTPDDNNYYTIINVTEDLNITVSGYKIKTFKPTLSIDPGCNIVPVGSDTVMYGSDYKFKVNSEEGYNLGKAKVYGRNLSLDPDINGIYTVSNITDDFTVSVTGVEINKYQVTIPTGEGYQVNSLDSTTVTYGDDFRFKVAAKDGYHLDKMVVKANDELVLPDISGTYTLKSVKEDISLSITGVARIEYTVTASNGEGYTVNVAPKVYHGDDLVFDIALATGYNGNGMVVSDGKKELTPDDMMGNYTISDVNGNIDITVTGVKKNKYQVTLPSSAGYTISTNDNTTVEHGDSFSFELSVKDGYSSDQLALTAANGTISNEGNKYTISNITGPIDLKIDGVVDDIKPTGEIKIKENSFKEFLNTISFDLFFKETVDVTISGQDAGSGVKNIYYYLSDQTLTANDLADKEWIDSDSFSIKPSNKEIVYAKIEDNAGNISYLSSKGVVVYEDALCDTESLFISTDKDSQDYKDLTVLVDLKGNEIDKVTVDDIAINWSTLNQGLVLEKESFIPLKKGDYDLEITIKPLGETFVGTSGAPNKLTVPLKVIDFNCLHDDLTRQVMKQATYFEEGLEYHICNICGKDIGEVVTSKTLDKTAPEIELSVDNVTYSEMNDTTSQLTNQAKTMVFSATDSESGVDKLEYLVSDQALSINKLLSADWSTFDGNYTLTNDRTRNAIVYVKATDSDGNVSYMSSVKYTIDVSKPELKDFDITGGNIVGDSYISNDNITITGKLSDNISGGGRVYYQIGNDPENYIDVSDDINIKLEDECKDNINIWVVDQAGNSSEKISKKIVIDKIAPTINITPVSNDWYLEKVDLNINGIDENGIKSVEVFDKLDNSKVDITKTGTFSIAKTGIHNLVITVVDNAGNTATKEAVYKVDLEAPQLSDKKQVGINDVEFVINSSEAVNGYYLLSDRVVDDEKIVSSGRTMSIDSSDKLYYDKLTANTKYYLHILATDQAGRQIRSVIEFTTLEKEDISDQLKVVVDNTIYGQTLAVSLVDDQDQPLEGITASYSGKALDGTVINNTTTAPVKAGEYEVIVNYQNESQQASLTKGFVITQKEVILNTDNFKVDDKVYDGTNIASLTGEMVISNKGNDDVLFAYDTATFANSDVSDNCAVTLSGVVLTGEDKDNYCLPNELPQLIGKITPAPASEEPNYTKTLALINDMYIITNDTGELKEIDMPEGWSFAENKELSGNNDEPNQEFVLQYQPLSSNYAPAKIKVLMPVSTLKFSPVIEINKLNSFSKISPFEVVGAKLPDDCDYSNDQLSWEIADKDILVSDQDNLLKAKENGYTRAQLLSNRGNVLYSYLVKVNDKSSSKLPNNLNKAIKNIDEVINELNDPKDQQQVISSVVDDVKKASDKDALSKEDIAALEQLIMDHFPVKVEVTGNNNNYPINISGALLGLNELKGNLVLKIESNGDRSFVIKGELDGQAVDLDFPLYLEIENIDDKLMKDYILKANGKEYSYTIKDNKLVLVLTNNVPVEFEKKASPKAVNTGDDLTLGSVSMLLLSMIGILSFRKRKEQ